MYSLFLNLNLFSGRSRRTAGPQVGGGGESQNIFCNSLLLLKKEPSEGWRGDRLQGKSLKELDLKVTLFFSYQFNILWTLKTFFCNSLSLLKKEPSEGRRGDRLQGKNLKELDLKVTLFFSYQFNILWFIITWCFLSLEREKRRGQELNLLKEC